MKSIPFRIVGLETEGFRLNSEVAIGKNVDINTKIGFAVNGKEKLVKCIVQYTYACEGKDFLNMTLSCIFAIEPAAFEGMQKDNKFVIEPFFSQYLATINVGAARGELHARCELANSPIAQITLPPINLVEALPEAIVINL